MFSVFWTVHLSTCILFVRRTYLLGLVGLIFSFDSVPTIFSFFISWIYGVYIFEIIISNLCYTSCFLDWFKVYQMYFAEVFFICHCGNIFLLIISFRVNVLMFSCCCLHLFLHNQPQSLTVLYKTVMLYHYRLWTHKNSTECSFSYGPERCFYSKSCLVALCVNVYMVSGSLSSGCYCTCYHRTIWVGRDL